MTTLTNQNLTNFKPKDTYKHGETIWHTEKLQDAPIDTYYHQLSIHNKQTPWQWEILFTVINHTPEPPKTYYYTKGLEP